jgi:tetratricopeptide (TPR) repeat protein
VARALEHQRRALAVFEAASGAHPEDATVLRHLHLVRGELARALNKSGARLEALLQYRGALAAAEARLRLLPQDPVARRDLNNGQSNLAIALLASGDLAEAARIMAPVLAFDEERLRADPRNSQAQRDVSWDLGMLGQIAFDGGRLEEALGYGRRQLDVDLTRARENPSFQARKEVAEGWSGLATVLARMERLDEALAMSKKAIADFETLRVQNPVQTRVAQLLAEEHTTSADICQRLATKAGTADRKTALWREARASLGRALDLFGDLDRRGALDADHRARPAEVSAQMARCDEALAALGRSEQRVNVVR